VLSTCSSLITVVHDHHSRQVVQFSHFSVKEFLTSDRLAVAAEDISFYHIAPAPAHTILAQACLGIVLGLDDTASETFVKRFPLSEYALKHWVDHVLFENVSSCIQDGIENLFDQDQPHFSRWIRNCGTMNYYYPWRDDDVMHDAAAMYYAAFCGFLDVIEKLIQERPEHINLRGGPLGTALHAAARTNHLNIVQSLLRHGADINAPGRWVRPGGDPLSFPPPSPNTRAFLNMMDSHNTPSVISGDLPSSKLSRHLEVALQVGHVNAEDKYDGCTSLHLAAYYGHFEIVRTLLKHNADTNARDDTGRTPLHGASERGHVDIVQFLLKLGADPKARDNDQVTSLHIVSSMGKLDIARLLLEHGAEVDAEDKSGRTAYQFALHNWYEEVVQLLLICGAKSRM
jgi:ankyrin repeat protein